VIGGLAFGLLFYLNYAAATGRWLDGGLCLIALALVVTAPRFAAISDAIDRRAAMAGRSHLLGRGARLGFQWLINIGLIGVLLLAAILSPASIEGMGGLAAAALTVTIASQGFQYCGLWLGRHGLGGPAGNTLAALAASLALNTLALTGNALVQQALVLFAISLSVLGLAAALRHDLAAYRHRPPAYPALDRSQP
jgi:hypothetical protein